VMELAGVGISSVDDVGVCNGWRGSSSLEHGASLPCLRFAIHIE
jgi:hypothetical protein